MKFTILMTAITYHEFEVEADSYKAAFALANTSPEMMLPSNIVGTRFDIESITLGGENEKTKSEP